MLHFNQHSDPPWLYQYSSHLDSSALVTMRVLFTLRNSAVHTLSATSHRLHDRLAKVADAELCAIGRADDLAVGGTRGSTGPVIVMFCGPFRVIGSLMSLSIGTREKFSSLLPISARWSAKGMFPYVSNLALLGW